MPHEIEFLIRRNDWDAARQAIRRELTRCPDSHWLLTRLSLTYYERRRYKLALRMSERAMRLAPRCPLVLWDHAGALDLLGREKEAVRIYERLLRRGMKKFAYDECGEGLRWAGRLLNDCRYRAALCYADLGENGRATALMRSHLAVRKKGVTSIYSVKDVKQKLTRLLHARGARVLLRGA